MLLPRRQMRNDSMAASVVGQGESIADGSPIPCRQMEGQPYYASKRIVTRVGDCPLSGEFLVANECLNLAEAV